MEIALYKPKAGFGGSVAVQIDGSHLLIHFNEIPYEEVKENLHYITDHLQGWTYQTRQEIYIKDGAVYEDLPSDVVDV